jgi:hypothetical protein
MREMNKMETLFRHCSTFIFECECEDLKEFLSFLKNAKKRSGAKGTLILCMEL